jgi:hypothetical protein
MMLRLRAPFSPQCRGSNRASGARRLSRKATHNAAGVKLDDLGGALERIFPQIVTGKLFWRRRGSNTVALLASVERLWSNPRGPCPWL